MVKLTSTHYSSQRVKFLKVFFCVSSPGTSVDWLSDDITWVSTFPHLKVSLHNLAIDQLQPDRDIILPRGNSFFAFMFFSSPEPKAHG